MGSSSIVRSKKCVAIARLRGSSIGWHVLIAGGGRTVVDSLYFALSNTLMLDADGTALRGRMGGHCVRCRS